jgi:RHS repeat-associated protein
MTSGATIGTQGASGTFAERGGVVTMTASANTTGIWQNISTIGAVTSVDSPTQSNEYVYGSYVDEPLALVTGGSTCFYADNRVYSPAVLTDSSALVQERYRYDSYGNRTVFAADDSTLRGASTYGNQRGFTGYYGDAESGLCYARARMYSPVLGRFVARDPLSYDQLISSFSDGTKLQILPSSVFMHAVPLYGNQIGFRNRDEEQKSCAIHGLGRLCDTTLGQWIEPSPLAYGDGWNLYASYFVPNSNDALGLCVTVKSLATLRNGGGPATKTGPPGAQWIPEDAVAPCTDGGTLYPDYVDKSKPHTWRWIKADIYNHLALHTLHR